MKGLSLGLTLLALAGCAGMSDRSSQGANGPAYVDRLMADEVAVAADAQRDYATVLAENGRVLTRKQQAIMTDQVDVDYLGKPQEILQSMAYRYGYSYIETGRRVDLRIINVRVAKAAPVEVLRSVGYQISYGAEVVLDKKSKAVRLIYKNVPAGKG
jgi:defect-in-organelle-trafficking protein DotD